MPVVKSEGVPFLAPSIYHFTAEMLRIAKDRRDAIVASWALAAVFSFLGVTGVLVVRVQQFWWGYYPRYSLLIAPPFLLFFFGYLIISMVEFVRAYPKSRGVEKKRIRLLLIAFAMRAFAQEWNVEVERHSDGSTPALPAAG